MRRTRKLLGALLALALCLTMLPVTAGAAEPDGWDGTADISWYNANETEFTITTAAQLAGLAQIVNSYVDGDTNEDSDAFAVKAFDGVTINLGADIDLGAHQWTPIGTYSAWDEYRAFSGTFNGNGHTISGLYINIGADTAIDDVGLFGYVRVGTVENLAVSGSVTGLPGDAASSGIGGVVGLSHGGTIRSCSFTGSVTGDANETERSLYVGGVVGHNTSATGTAEGTVSDCINKGTICITNTKAGPSTYYFVGGVVGNNSGTIKHCTNAGPCQQPSHRRRHSGGVDRRNGHGLL